jgi:hypothetical protein
VPEFLKLNGLGFRNVAVMRCSDFECREYPHLNGRESVIVHRIEELCESGMERHAAMAVDNRASTHLQVCLLTFAISVSVKR